MRLSRLVVHDRVFFKARQGYASAQHCRCVSGYVWVVVEGTVATSTIEDLPVSQEEDHFRDPMNEMCWREYEGMMMGRSTGLRDETGEGRQEELV